jgi:hypothetical protein
MSAVLISKYLTRSQMTFGFNFGEHRVLNRVECVRRGGGGYCVQLSRETAELIHLPHLVKRALPLKEKPHNRYVASSTLGDHKIHC